MNVTAFVICAVFPLVRWLVRTHAAWQFYVERNEAALAESGMRRGGSMSFRRFATDMNGFTRRIYTARWEQSLSERMTQ